MEEVRQLVQEEGREARNLVAFHVAVDTPIARFARKPPRSTVPPPRRAPPRPAASRLRSASAGRDKRSELRARYWALLFGDLQRAVGEIYNTVEAHENLNECQEVILVLENYTRDFKALGEWFRLKWEYDNTPPPQRPQSLAWEIRKTDFVRPESRRAHSVKSSPSVSGKNSPCLSGHNTPSGKNSPNLTGKASPGSGKISPRVSSGHATSPKANIEFFSNKIATASKVTTNTKTELKQETKLTDIKEKDIINVEKHVEKQMPVLQVQNENAEKLEPLIVEIGKAKQCPNVSPKPVVVKSSKNKAVPDNAKKVPNKELSIQAKATKATLDAMENDFLSKQLVNNKVKNDNLINQDIDAQRKREINETVESNIADKLTANEKTNGLVNSDSTKNKDEVVHKKTINEVIVKSSTVTDSENKVSIDAVTDNESPTKSEDNFADVSNESSTKSIEDKHNKTDGLPKKEAIKKEELVSNPSGMDNNTANTQEVEDALLGEKKVNDVVSQDCPEVKDTVKNKDELKNDNDFKKPEPKVDTKTFVRPAYSQAAAKPKATTTKIEIKTLARSTPLARSKTVVEIRPNTASKTQKICPKRNQTSKCSYPFNLTTGRTSLFDASSNVVNKSTVPRKVANKNVQMGSGDSKFNQPKVEVKKRPLRPTSLKVNEKLDKKEKSTSALENIKDCEEYSSSDTIVTQIDRSRLESSESLRTLVPDDLELIHDAANSVEVLNVDSNKNDNDGWLTVKSRRLSRESKKQSKSHWSNRFHQPSATTSLPTLNMIESPKQEVKPIINTTAANKVDRAKSEQPQIVKPEKVVTVFPKNRVDGKTKTNLAMIRQKSDVTGLKRSARSKALSKKAEKVKDTPKDSESSELTKNRLHSSLESLTTGLARSQESTEEVFDFDKWKAEFRSTFKYLEDDDQMPNHNEILKSADPSEMSEIAAMTSQIEENEKKISWALDFQSDVDQRKLCEEEDLLNRQIMELQQVSDIDLDTETDDTETDAEILCEDVPSLASPENLGALAASLEDQYETALAGMSWAERVDTLVVLEALVARDPGRAQQLHAKLSQGIKRRGSFQDALRRLQAKQARAERQRLEYQTERAKKIHLLLARVEEVKVAKNQLIEEKRLRMERRLQKATENRDQHLKDIVRKAHDEEEKLREIAFIKQLEAENRRHEFLDQCRTHTTRLRRVRRDRLNKLEQKAAREAAVGARRQALEAERQRHVQTLLERRRERDRRVDGLREMRRQERDIAAREKAEGVKSRLSALAAAAELEADALRSRIRDKQDASQQRLESHLQAIREKATGPRQPTTSESQDNDLDEAVRLEQERKERDKTKALKKKARKVKQKLLASGNDQSASELRIPIDAFLYPAVNKMYKVFQQINNILSPLLVGENDEQKTEKRETNTKEKHETDVKQTNKTEIKVNGDVSKDEKTAEQQPEIKVNGDDAKEETVEKKKSKKKKNVEKQESSENNNNNNVATEVKEGKKSKKKKKDDKLKKTESICSSLSDMSKTSDKNERKNKVSLDTMHLERLLNELHRMLDKPDKQASDKAVFKKLHGLKALEQLLALAAEREDLANQITSKCVSTAVSISTRGASTDPESARNLLSSNASVHVVKLLANQMEKDLSDPREMELACLLLDWLSMALDSVTQIVSPPATWARAHMLVRLVVQEDPHRSSGDGADVSPTGLVVGGPGLRDADSLATGHLGEGSHACQLPLPEWRGPRGHRGRGPRRAAHAAHRLLHAVQAARTRRQLY
ncbi:S phase cyclin A-associated protein in the endoplasmic reticulum [Cydia strobilella]|uniref:S phase cyclin A-associated protein in the endoplasmic reticulum n=1 Tax=Cydia strobilella TaxID=1100964 RepID=UPI0030049503